MSTLLLTTKLYIPLLRPELVSRPRLLERLNAGLHRTPGVTLVSAPAGFGKTTLLSEWAGECRRPIAWVSLDKDDNDPIRFWAYVIAALQTVQADVGSTALAMLHAVQPQRPSVEVVLIDLINELAEGAEASALVLDDYHVIGTQSIHEALAFLIDHLPPQLHLVIASRTDPPLPLSRLRARGRLAELRTVDLRFTPAEAAAFLNQVMGLDLTVEEVAALEARTEGWIVGLQLAALSLQGQDPTHVTGFITALTGSHRYILDYLTEEVLQRQPDSIQSFLLHTAILDRLTGDLCDAVRFGYAETHTGRADGQAMLERLEQANLFVVPLDSERRWYRYHHLFSDLLRSRLEQTQPDRVSTLHRRASEWYEQHGWIAAAASHAFAAGDIERVARLVEENAAATIGHGELRTLVGWLDTLPDEVVRARPRLCVAYAWARAYVGPLDAVEPLLQDVEEALARGVGAGERGAEQRIAGHIAVIRAYVANHRGDRSRGAEFARTALEHLPEGDPMRGFAAVQLAMALHASGDLQAAVQVMAEASAIGQTADDSHVAVTILCDLAGLQFTQGHLRQAAATYRETLRRVDDYHRRSGRQLPVTGYAYGRLSCVLYEWNDLEAALHYTRAGLELCERWGIAEFMADSNVYLALALQAMGDASGALDAIQQARRASSNVSPWFVAETDAYEARIRLAQGDLATASRWATAQEGKLNVGDEPILQCLRRYCTLARIRIAQGTEQSNASLLDRALELLAWLLNITAATGAMFHVVKILTLQALALQALGRVDEALAALAHALSLAEPEGYVRTFIDEGAPMGELLRQAAARGIAVEYVGKLLVALEVSEHGGMEVLSHFPTQPLIEPLSARELEVLRLLAAGLSNREIAQTLYIVVGTVKNHLKNIYGKLGVHSRTEAVARARDLGLL